MHKIITTSWDDGHELDFKLAGLLNKYDLPATFYIPRTNLEHSVMSEAQVKELAGKFEIGGHTLSHIRLSNVNNKVIDHEVSGSFKWLSDLLGYPPVSFCFPGGVFNGSAVSSVFKAGYQFARTTELLSTQPVYDNKLMPTTVQLYEHPVLSYFKNTAKRKRWTSMLQWLKSNTEKDISKLTEFYLKRIEETGGCFHLWGHSWEIEEFGLWKKTEQVLKILSQQTGFVHLQNGDIIKYSEQE